MRVAVARAGTVAVPEADDRRRIIDDARGSGHIDDLWRVLHIGAQHMLDGGGPAAGMHVAFGSPNVSTNANTRSSKRIPAWTRKRRPPPGSHPKASSLWPSGDESAPPGNSLPAHRPTQLFLRRVGGLRSTSNRGRSRITRGLVGPSAGLRVFCIETISTFATLAPWSPLNFLSL